MRRGFTLVELLVVVTIIVVLLSLLTPSLDKAMGTARQAVCLTNVRSWSFATRQYAYDFKGKVIYINGNRGQYWYDRLRGYIGEPNYDPAPAQADPPAGMMKANYCPETTVASLGFGSARLTWLNNTAHGSYGWNLWMADYTHYYNTDTRFPHEDFYTKVTNAPGDAPILGDSNWIGSWPDDTDIVPADLENPPSPHESGFFMSRFAVARHEKSIGVGTVDGSARSVPLWDLWRMPWHQNSKPTTRDPREFK